MNPNRKRELLLKELNKELKLYLRAYDPSHPHYKRNIKNLYEGLMETGILMGIETSQHFKQFKETFHKADRGLKLALITTNILGDTDLGRYYTYKGKPIHRIKLLGNLFVPKIRNPKLDEANRVSHMRAQELLTHTIADERDLEEIKKNIREIKLTEADYQDKVRNIRKINALVEAFINKYDVKEAKTSVAGTELDELEKSLQKVDKILNKVSKIKAINERTLTDLEIADAEIIKNVKLRTDLENDKIKNLTDILKVRKITIEEDYKKISDEQLNLVQGLTEIIDLRQQLQQFLQFVDKNRVSFTDHWEVFRYKTKPQEADDDDVEDEGNRFGDKVEGFEMKEFEWLANGLETYKHLFDSFKQILPSGELTNKLTQLNFSNNELIMILKNPEAYFQQGDVLRNALGQITNIDEHDLVNHITLRIQTIFKELYNRTGDAIDLCAKTLTYNEDMIKKAKGTRKTALAKIMELEKIEKNLARIEKRQTTNKDKKVEEDTTTPDDLYELE